MTALPPGFRAGIRHFNAGRYFEAHEAFEETLDEVEGDDRWELGLALIQVAVGYHKCANGHPGGARMLSLGAEKLAPFPPDAWGIDVAALRRRVADDLGRLAHDDDPFGTPPRIVAAGRP
jgi:uncharacterized protein